MGAGAGPAAWFGQRQRLCDFLAFLTQWQGGCSECVLVKGRQEAGEAGSGHQESKRFPETPLFLDFYGCQTWPPLAVGDAEQVSTFRAPVSRAGASGRRVSCPRAGSPLLLCRVCACAHVCVTVIPLPTPHRRSRENWAPGEAPVLPGFGGGGPGGHEW